MGRPQIRPHDVVLVKKLNNVLYELMVKTRANMVYVTDTMTLTEKLVSIANELLSINVKHDTLENAFADLMRDAPETFNTLKKIWDYVNVNGDPESELIQLIKSKQDAEEGKGLSTHDLTDLLYEKLVNDYTPEELNEKFDDINTKFVSIDEQFVLITDDLTAQGERIDAIESKMGTNVVSREEPPGLADFTLWYKIESEDE